MPATQPATVGEVVTVNQQDLEMIEAYLKHMRRSNCSAATLRGRRTILTALNRELIYGLGEASTEELAQWLDRDEWSTNTKATYYRCMRSFYAWAANPRNPWVTFDPTDDMEPRRGARGVARPVTDRQLQELLGRCREPIRTWVVIAAYQGLRCIEIAGLLREHITQDRLLVVRGKGGAPRVHDTDPYVWAAVKDLPLGPVARRLNGTQADAFYVSWTAAVYFKRQLQMEGVSMHRLRHWLGVSTQRVYKDIRVTQAVLGHRSLTSTQIYTDATDQQQRDARAMLPRLAG